MPRLIRALAFAALLWPAAARAAQVPIRSDVPCERTRSCYRETEPVERVEPDAPPAGEPAPSAGAPATPPPTQVGRQPRGPLPPGAPAGPGDGLPVSEPIGPGGPSSAGAPTGAGAPAGPVGPGGPAAGPGGQGTPGSGEGPGGGSGPNGSGQHLQSQGEREAAAAQGTADRMIARALEAARAAGSPFGPGREESGAGGPRGPSGNDFFNGSGAGGLGPQGADSSSAFGAAPLLGKGFAPNAGGRVLSRATADGKSSEDHFNDARARFAAGDDEGAATSATRALELQPSDARSLTLRSEANNKLKRYGRAYNDARSALLLDPRNRRARRNQAWAEYKGGGVRQALAALDEMLASGADPQAALMRAYIRDQSGDRAGALADLRLAAKLDPRYGKIVDAYEKGGAIPDPFDRTILVPTVGGLGRAGKLLLLLLFAALFVFAWLAGRRAMEDHLVSPAGVRSLLGRFLAVLPGGRPAPAAEDARPAWPKPRGQAGLKK